MISEQEARTLLGPEGAAVLIEVVHGAWNDHVAEKKLRSATTRANVVWDYMIARADEKFATMDGVVRRIVNGRPVFIVRNRMVLRFKKHSDELFTSNVLTESQAILDEQGAFEGMPTLPHVSCGYVLDAAEAAVRRIVVVRKVQQRVEWYIDLPELASGQMAPTRPIMPIGPSQPKLPAIRKRPTSATEDES